MPKTKTKNIVDNITNAAAKTYAASEPYSVQVRIRGVCDLLFKRWDSEAVKAKAAGVKGSISRKTDDLESYVYRDTEGYICLPGEYVRQSTIRAAKSFQDPRSPRKSAMDIFKAGLVALTLLARLGNKKEWDYEDARRVIIQGSAITRIRPAFSASWEAEFIFQVFTPEYISPEFLHEVMVNAGRLVGVGDFRPTFGRFQIVNWKVL